MLLWSYGSFANTQENGILSDKIAFQKGEFRLGEWQATCTFQNPSFDGNRLNSVITNSVGFSLMAYIEPAQEIAKKICTLAQQHHICHQLRGTAIS